MKNPLIIAVLACFFMDAVYAQSGNNIPLRINDNVKSRMTSTRPYNTLARIHALNAGSVNPVLKATSTGERLTAYTYSVPDSTGQLWTDSTVYVYSGNNSSVFDYDMLWYITEFYYLNNSLKGGIVSDFVKYDTAYHFLAGLQPSPYYTSYYVYSNSGMPLVHISGDTNFIGTYNSQDQLTEEIKTEHGFPERTYITYAGDLVKKDSIQQYFSYGNGFWENDEVNEYEYNAAKQLTAINTYYWQTSTSTWERNGGYLSNSPGLTTIAYHSNGKVASIMYHKYDNGNWKEFSKDLVTYEGSSIKSLFTINMDLNDNWTDTIYKEIRTLNNDKIPTRVDTWRYVEILNTTEEVSMVYDYNSNNNPLSVTVTEDGSDYVVRCYYETFDNTGIATTVKDQIEIYPNPATHTLHIRAGNEPVYTGGRMQFEIVNTLGQKAHSGFADMHSRSTDFTIPIHTLQPGIYQVRIMDMGSGKTHHAAFVKQ